MANNKDKKVLNVPVLRFPEFTDEWKRIKVSDLLDFYSTNSLSWALRLNPRWTSYFDRFDKG